MANRPMLSALIAGVCAILGLAMFAGCEESAPSEGTLVINNDDGDITNSGNHDDDPRASDDDDDDNNDFDPVVVEDDDDNNEGHTSIYCADADNDGYGNPNEAIPAESVTTGYVGNCTDCNDQNSSVHPGATDSTVDGVDQDCDSKDGVTSTTTYTWYLDYDNDGYGASSGTPKSTSTNTAPSGYVNNSSDCNDADSAINPSKSEVTGNGKDDDCNSATSDTASSSSSRTSMTLTVVPDSSSTSWNLSVANTTASDWSQWFATTTTWTGTQSKTVSAMKGDVLYLNGKYDGGWLVENTSSSTCTEHVSSATLAGTSYSVTTATSGADCVCSSNGSGGWNLVCTVK